MSTLNEVWKNRKLILEGIGNTVVKRKITEEIAAERKAICTDCSFLNNGCNSATGNCCGACGCKIEFKTRAMGASCPENKWQAVKVNP